MVPSLVPDVPDNVLAPIQVAATQALAKHKNTIPAPKQIAPQLLLSVVLSSSSSVCFIAASIMLT